MGSMSPPPGQFRQPTPPQRPTVSARSSSTPIRGGCLTIFLILIVVANASVIPLYSSSSGTASQALSSIPQSTRGFLSLLALLNCGFALAIFWWRKWGFYGIVATTLISILINTSAGVAKGVVAASLVGPIVLWLLLRSHWSDMR